MDNPPLGETPSSFGAGWPPAAQPAIWPPPPANTTPQVSILFRTLFRRVLGTVPAIRTGTLTLSADGMAVRGKAVLPYEWQIPILCVCWLVGIVVPFIFLGGYLVLEYAVRREDAFLVPWKNIRSVTLVPKRQWVCFSYDAPNYRGVVKTFSLTTRVDPLQYAGFVQAAETYAPEKTASGKLRAWTSPRVWIVLIGLVLRLGVVFLVGASGAFGSH